MEALPITLNTRSSVSSWYKTTKDLTLTVNSEPADILMMASKPLKIDSPSKAAINEKKIIKRNCFILGVHTGCFYHRMTFRECSVRNTLRLQMSIAEKCNQHAEMLHLFDDTSVGSKLIIFVSLLRSFTQWVNNYYYIGPKWGQILLKKSHILAKSWDNGAAAQRQKGMSEIFSRLCQIYFPD